MPQVKARSFIVAKAISASVSLSHKVYLVCAIQFR
jgi:hypothetical protein